MDCKCYVAKGNWSPSNVQRFTFKCLDHPNCYHGVDNFKLKERYSYKEVEGIGYHDRTTLCEIPKNLIAIFPNLIALDLNGCGMTKVTRGDLVGLHSLREIALRKMKIEVIEGKTNY